MVQIYKPNVDMIRQQAQAAKEQEQNRSGGDFRWGNWEIGENILRVLPPTNSRGLFGKQVGKHYFNNTPLASVVESAITCLIATFPDHPNVFCSVCQAGDRILQSYPGVKIGRWHKPGVKWYVQGLNRMPKQTAQGPVLDLLASIYGFTSALYNWYIQQFESVLKQYQIDISDLKAGIDIKVVHSIEKRKGKGQGEFKKYEPTLWNMTGPGPVFNDEQKIQNLMNSMYDLDEIWKFPNDEMLDGMRKAGTDIIHHYTKKQYENNPQSVQVPGLGMQIQQPMMQPPPATMQQAVQMPQQVQQMPAQVVQPQSTMPTAQVQQAMPNPVTVAAAAVAQVLPSPQVMPVAQVSQVPLTQVQPAQTMPATQVQQPTMQQVPVPTTTPQVGAPTDRPACWGGANPRPDGGRFYSSDSEVCLMCPHEMTCMEIKPQAPDNG